MRTWLYALASVAVVSGVPLAVLLVLPRDERRRAMVVRDLISFAVGALLAGALLHLLPEASQRVGPRVAAYHALLGFFGFFVLEKVIRFPRRRRRIAEPSAVPRLPPAATLNLVGDGVHNLIDGAVIAASYAASPALGAASTVAVLLHEVPQEVGDFGVLLYGGLPVKRAALYNLASALSALVGAALVLTVGTRVEALVDALLGIAAGNFLYIAAADLVPDLQREHNPAVSARQLAFILLGAALLAVPELAA